MWVTDSAPTTVASITGEGARDPQPGDGTPVMTGQLDGDTGVGAQSNPLLPGPLRSAVVANPARVTDLGDRRRVIERVLDEAGWPAPSWWETTPQDPGTGQARWAVADGAQLVFACGGDGTVRAVIAGMLGTDAALAVLPAGTGNLLATNLELPDDPAQGVRLAIAGGRRKLDIGRVDGQVFAVMAGMGFDAAMMDDASSTLKARVGPIAYIFSGLQHLWDRPMSLQVQIDDDAPIRYLARSVLVGNVGRLQGGVRLLPHAEPDNGQLEVAILRPRHLGHWVQLAAAVVLRRSRVPRMTTLRGRRISIIADRPHPRQLDGDVIEPADNLTATVLPGAVGLCVARLSDRPSRPEGSGQ